MEVSAKEKIRNEECFFEVVREIRNKDNPPSAGGSGRGKKKPCLIL